MIDSTLEDAILVILPKVHFNSKCPTPEYTELVKLIRCLWNRILLEEVKVLRWLRIYCLLWKQWRY
jgi:hypothetical protein